MFKDLIALTKPRLLRMNVFAAIGGFWVASKWNIDWLALLWVVIGSTITIASACVINNYWDRELDQKMERTKNRALPTGRLTPGFVLSYGIALGVIGLAVLFLLVNPLTGWLGFLGWFVYIFIYTIWLKRSSTWSTSIGGISGAMPPVLGYCAVTSEVDAGAWLLFAFLFLWQPPHFWSLGIRRVEEYRAAQYPLLPVVKGIKRTKLQMIPYTVLLIPTCILLYTYGYAGIVFLIISVLASVIWAVHTIMGLKAANDEKWAKVNFLISVNYLMVVFIVMIANTIK
ncbi:heme o synthase [Paenibacillus radicis (ex Gao et al. 2016)]|uniref:Protoheme IX farnesyltransferase n=1 Tax=Paenibacillus radicis (ex Gao et al. 2016) TaxID=1737354 RepID=A0A917H0U5_9BACL|nr:heme o synthase [Paenibacillus radicis (ex Gao et al. 2016)]GGG63912.1 protoheme IX farnesyltransferase 1 [Paenibacillus radicis (ex Gao et al. 2016)]